MPIYVCTYVSLLYVHTYLRTLRTSVCSIAGKYCTCSNWHACTTNEGNRRNVRNVCNVNLDTRESTAPRVLHSPAATAQLPACRSSAPNVMITRHLVISVLLGHVLVGDWLTKRQHPPDRTTLSPKRLSLTGCSRGVKKDGTRGRPYPGQGLAGAVDRLARPILTSAGEDVTLPCRLTGDCSDLLAPSPAWLLPVCRGRRGLTAQRRASGNRSRRRKPG